MGWGYGVLSKKEKLYVAFVDFRKYYDTMNRDFLFYKLQSYGITGKCYHLIKSMYDNNQYKVKTSHGLTEKITSSSGLKQGCNLNPTLAN